MVLKFLFHLCENGYLVAYIYIFQVPKRQYTGLMELNVQCFWGNRNGRYFLFRISAFLIANRLLYIKFR